MALQMYTALFYSSLAMVQHAHYGIWSLLSGTIGLTKWALWSMQQPSWLNFSAIPCPQLHTLAQNTRLKQYSYGCGYTGIFFSIHTGAGMSWECRIWVRRV
ncbi:hypothetical protein NEOLEDRAFT_1143311 [Neolentinus lepideus HHB14362 ss-1]|uniref:Uncharacterized protein n=1 Tax=Neolentinus lepideus HHB14362 ss-1 TaxID=1314782 RepID=A0A165MM88_9AGAM|nr:hypothetical protein NEOLEDRAFT_1143311 [Neolentinus lepideus HHB14362 ss-1]